MASRAFIFVGINHSHLGRRWEAARSQFSGDLPFDRVASTLLEMTGRHKRCGASPYGGCNVRTQHRAQPIAERARQAGQVGEFPRPRQCEPERTDPAFGKGLAHGAHCGLISMVQPHRRPEKDVVKMDVAVQVQRQNMSMVVRSE
ncbi:MAG: hypothetical protein A3G81_04445 [Betaproteobacteria bacterium RIFCSPLOWO2_12_FULL_65_14]|nr:MAG: hypothetical protein A3G81_04445 [Betaproteobacteria bacterium RIFCSPLOWO2_12_FULL_65_14]